MATWTKTKWWWCPTPPRRSSARSRARPPPPPCASGSRSPAPFVLSVGDLQPRKNQIGLIRAFARLVRAYPQLKHNLVLAGKETWFADRVHEAARESGVADRIQFCRFRLRRRPAAALQRLRPVRLPVVLRRFRIAGAGSHGLRARGGLLQHFGAAGSGGWRGILFDPYARRRNRARHGRPAAGCANCARAWSGSACSARRTSVGRRPRSELSKFSTKCWRQPRAAQRRSTPRP